MSLYGRKLFISKRKRILKKSFVGVSLLFVGILALFCISTLSKSYFPSEWITHPFFALFLMTLIAIVAYKPLDLLFTELLRRYFFKHRSYVHIVLMNLAEELELVLDLDELANLIVNTFGEVLHLKTVALLVREKKTDEYVIASAFGWPISDYRRVRLSRDSALLNLIQVSGPHVLVRNRVVRMLDWRDANLTARDFDTLRAGWAIPLMIKGELIGLLVFSAQQSERTFDETDFHFFRKFADSVSRKVHNAMHYLELKKAHMELQDVQSKLIQMTKLTAIEQLATGIAHQIHNPLTIISGKAQVLLLQKDRAHLDERVEEALKTIVKQTKRAADITKKLSMFAQSSGTPKEAVRLEQILEDTLALVSYQTSLEAIEITKDINPRLPAFYANIHEMREVFFNLILNAVQSVGSHGKIHVTMNYRVEEQVIRIQVADTGKGIERGHIEKLFNPFFSTRGEALGLGLFITKQIVHRYGGAIRVESSLGAGSLFIIQFPYSEKVSPLEAEQRPSVSFETHGR